MPCLDIVRQSNIKRTARVMQAEGIFDIAPSQKTEERWHIDFTLPDPWNIGLIVGPSGSGKSTLIQEAFRDHIAPVYHWPTDKSLLDGFPVGMSIKDICELLSSVGFSSPPSWLKPYAVLSNGEQFRVNMARTLAEMPEMTVVDEFTSVVDRTVAQIGSAAIAKTVRRRNQKLIAATCHYDVMEWLEPDWIYQPHTGEFVSERSERRPPIDLEIRRVHSSAWNMFRKHHYLDTNLHTAAQCFCAFWKGVPVAFSSFLHFPHPKMRNCKREHRTVCLPDFQGVGIGNALSAWVGALCRENGFRFQSQTSHPGMIRSRNCSPLWKMIARPNYTSGGMPHAGMRQGAPGSGVKKQATRLRATFEYVGPAMDKSQAVSMWSG